jgi:predicted HTH transcriptional regulator
VLRKDLEELRTRGALTEILSSNDPVNEKRNPINVPAKRDSVTVKDKNVTLNASQAKILSLIKHQQGITVDEMAEAISRNRRTVLRTVRALVEYGAIERVGSDKAGYWKVREDE